MLCDLQGLSELELPWASPHVAAESCEGAGARRSRPHPRQQQGLAAQAPDAAREGGPVDNSSEECGSQRVDCGCCETGSEGSVGVFPVSDSESQEGSQEDGACHSSHTEEEEGRDTPVRSSPTLHRCDGSEGAHQPIAVGASPPAGCGDQAEETGGLEALTQEGREPSGQEAGRREEEADSAELLLDTSAMGQSSSSEDSCSEMKEGSEEGGNSEEEAMKEEQKPRDGVSPDEASPGDEPGPLIEGGDVIEGPGSPVPHHLIEALHEGEPPPDINSLEQNQETAVEDYAAEPERGLAAPTGRHPGSCSEADGIKELDGENAPEVPGRSPEHTQPDAHALEQPMEDTCTETPPDGSGSADRGSPVTSDLSGGGDCTLQTTRTEAVTPPQDCVPPVDTESVEEQREGEAEADAGAALRMDGERSQAELCLDPHGTGEELSPEPPQEDGGSGPAPEVQEDTSGECSAAPELVEPEAEETGSGEGTLQPSAFSPHQDLSVDQSETPPEEDAALPSDQSELDLEDNGASGGGGAEPPDVLEGARQSAIEGEQTAIAASHGRFTLLPRARTCARSSVCLGLVLEQTGAVRVHLCC